jgi:maltose alpha-D-glucosyltransferase/alpha-amylase
LLPLIGGAETEPDGSHELFGGSLETARLLGRRTAELHLVLAANRADPALAAEPYTKLFQRSVYQTMRNQIGRVGQRLVRERERLPDHVRDIADVVVREREAILRRFRTVLDIGFCGVRIRCHGDLHLAQLLFTGKDFVIIDFEGEASKALEERRVKRSPLRDVAGMVRSFDFAARSVLLGFVTKQGHSPGVIRPEDRPVLEPWAEVWVNRASRAYVAEYVHATEGTNLLPPIEADRRLMLDLFVLEKALHETENELTNRPAWAELPLRAVPVLRARAPDQFFRSGAL